MDQSVSPGTGNIIKNEALHRARVAPDRKVGDLSEDEVKAVVRELRSYARAWLAGRRPPMLVYDKAAKRQHGESQIIYTTRKATLFKDLAREGCALPDEAKA